MLGFDTLASSDPVALTLRRRSELRVGQIALREPRHLPLLFALPGRFGGVSWAIFSETIVWCGALGRCTTFPTFRAGNRWVRTVGLVRFGVDLGECGPERTDVVGSSAGVADAFVPGDVPGRLVDD